MDYRDTTIIIPTYNEEKNIARLLPCLSKLLPKVYIMIADDGSSDRTQAIARKKGAEVFDRSLSAVHGLTASVVDAILTCKTKYFVVMDADFQHPPEKIKDIVSKLRNDKKNRNEREGADIVIGNRAEIDKGWSLSRRIISGTAYILGRMRLMIKGSFKYGRYDILSGFFGCKTQAAKKVISETSRKFEMKGYKVLFDLLKYLPDSTKVERVDYTFGTRKEGQSKLNMRIMFYYLRSCFK